MDMKWIDKLYEMLLNILMLFPLWILLAFIIGNIIRYGFN